MTNLIAITKDGEVRRMHLHATDFDGDVICSTLIFASQGGILRGAVLAEGLGVHRERVHA